MAGKAQEIITQFWEKQDSGDYIALTEMFSEDAIAEDEAVGSFHGKEAIMGFMTQMAEELPKLGVRFEVQEISGDEQTAWAKWVAIYEDGRRFEGVGIYKIRDGKIAYYRDYHAIPQASGS